MTPSVPVSPSKSTGATKFVPYGAHWIEEDDIQAVIQALRSDWLTTGPLVGRFEQQLAALVGSAEAVAVSNGTAALHAAMYALGVGPGDEVIVPAMTFAATANCVVFQGGTPVFADVEPDTLLIDPASVAARITPRTKAIIAVDYAGQPCDYAALRALANKHRLALVADACHSLGASYHGVRAGTLADISTFSFHPVKPMTTGEGGAVTTNDPQLGRRARLFRNHGITTDHRQRERSGTWFYEMVDLGFNYRLTDIQCALGLNQLSKLERWTQGRQAIARTYDSAFAELPSISPLAVRPEVSHAYHLYVVRWRARGTSPDRTSAFGLLRQAGVGVNVHYIPVHLHPFYREKFATQPGTCPVAEKAYEEILSLPIFPRMQESDVRHVIREVMRIAQSDQQTTQHRAA